MEYMIFLIPLIGLVLAVLRYENEKIKIEFRCEKHVYWLFKRLVTGLNPTHSKQIECVRDINDKISGYDTLKSNMDILRTLRSTLEEFDDIDVIEEIIFYVTHGYFSHVYRVVVYSDGVDELQSNHI